MLYTYTAKDGKGATYSAEMESPSKLEVYEKVRREGGRIQSVREKRKNVLTMPLGGIFARISTRDKILFAKNLSSMLTAGLTVTRALDVMEKQTRVKPFQALLRSLSSEVSKGESLSGALARRGRSFPTVFVAMVKAGEESGNLAESLREVSLQMEKSYALVRRVRSALIYPAVVLAIMVIISILLLIYMVPTLTHTFEGLSMELPLSTRIIIASSDFLLEHTLLAFGSLAGFVLLAALFAKSPFGKRIIDRTVLYLPGLGNIAKEVESARTARTLSSLLSAGVPIVKALEIAEAVLGNHLHRRALSEARSAVQRGESVSAVLARHERVYPPFLSEMAAVGEETGKISEMLGNAARYYEESVDEKTKNLSTLIEPLLMVIIGAAVATFAISMLAPTYSLVENI